MGRWAQANRRGGAGAQSFPNFGKPTQFALSKNGGSNRMQIDVILPVAPDSATYRLFDLAAPTVQLDLIATANVQVFTQDFATFVPISGHTYFANATINKVGFAQTVYLSNTSVAP
jgi:hypothetical protein